MKIHFCHHFFTFRTKHDHFPKPTFLPRGMFSAIFQNLWRAGDVRDRLRISSSFDLRGSKIPINSVSLPTQVFPNPRDLGFLSRYTQGRLGDEQKTPIPPFGDIPSGPNNNTWHPGRRPCHNRLYNGTHYHDVN